ncbi:hypothetical protein QTN25_009793 [Entamoeba marina]
MKSDGFGHPNVKKDDDSNTLTEVSEDFNHPKSHHTPDQHPHHDNYENKPLAPFPTNYRPPSQQQKDFPVVNFPYPDSSFPRQYDNPTKRRSDIDIPSKRSLHDYDAFPYSNSIPPVHNKRIDQEFPQNYPAPFPSAQKSQDQYYSRAVKDPFYSHYIFETFEAYFCTFGAQVDRWPNEAFEKIPIYEVKKLVAETLQSPEKMRECPIHIKNRIYEFTALQHTLCSIFEGVFELPFDLELIYKEGWERSCDIYLMKEMVVYGLGRYDRYINSEGISYILTQVMKLTKDQKLQFIKLRCAFLLRCILTKR